MKTYFRILIEHEEFYCDSVQIVASGKTINFKAYFPPIPALMELPPNTYAVVQVKNDLFNTEGEGWITAVDGLLKSAQRIKRPTKNEISLDFVAPFDWPMSIKLLNFDQLPDNVSKELLVRNHNYPDFKSLGLGENNSGVLGINYVLNQIMSKYFGINQDDSEVVELKKDTLFFSVITYLSVLQNDFMDLEDAYHFSRRIVFGDPNFLEGADINYRSDNNFATEGTNSEKQPYQKGVLKALFNKSILDFAQNAQGETSLMQILSVFADNMEHNLYGQLFPKLSSYNANSEGESFPKQIKNIRNKYYSDLLTLGEEDKNMGIGQYLFIPQSFAYIPPSSNIILPSQISSINFEVQHKYPTRVGTTFGSTNGNISLSPYVTGIYPGPLRQSTYPKKGLTMDELYSIRNDTSNDALSFDKMKTLVASNNLNNRAMGTYYSEQVEYKDVMSYMVNIDNEEQADNEESDEIITNTVDSESFNESVAVISRKSYNENWAKSRMMQVQLDFNPYIANGLPAMIITNSGIYFGQVNSVSHVFNSKGAPTTSITLNNVDQLNYPIEENKWWLTTESYYRVNNHEEFYSRIGLQSFGKVIYDHLSGYLESESDNKDSIVQFCNEHIKGLNKLGYTFKDNKINKMSLEEKKQHSRVNNAFDIIKLMKDFILQYLLPNQIYKTSNSFKQTEDKNIDIVKLLYKFNGDKNIFLSTNKLQHFLVSSNDEKELEEAKKILESMSTVKKVTKDNFSLLSTDYVKINDFKPIIDSNDILNKQLEEFIAGLETGKDINNSLTLSSIAEVRYFIIKLLKQMVEAYTTISYQQLPIFALNNMNDAVWAVYELAKVYQILPVINKTGDSNREVRYIAELRKAKEILKYMPETERKEV